MNVYTPLLKRIRLEINNMKEKGCVKISVRTVESKSLRYTQSGLWDKKGSSVKPAILFA